MIAQGLRLKPPGSARWARRAARAPALSATAATCLVNTPSFAQHRTGKPLQEGIVGDSQPAPPSHVHEVPMPMAPVPHSHPQVHDQSKNQPIYQIGYSNGQDGDLLRTLVAPATAVSVTRLASR